MRRFLQLVICAAALLPIARTPGALAGTSLQAREIRIFGNEKIKPYIILRAIPFQAGDYFDKQLLQAARERVRAVPGVDFTEIRVGYIPLDSMTVVSVVITEKPTLRGHLLTRRGYENKISIGIKAVERNFRGRSEKLYVLGMFRGNTQFAAGWENPWIGDALHLGIAFDAFYRNYNYVYDDMGGTFAGAEIERYGATASLYHPAGAKQRIGITAGFETVTSPVDGVAVSGERDSYATAALVFERDSRNSLAFPWDATLVKASAALIGPGDDALSLFEGSIDARAYRSLFSRSVLAAQAVYRMRDGDTIPLYRREHIGGARTLRGYDYGTFNGTNSLSGCMEYRIPFNFSKAEPVEDLLLGVSLHLFAETAAAWENNQNLSDDLLHGSFGLGVSLLTLNASGIRFDYAWHQRSSGRWEIDAGLKF